MTRSIIPEQAAAKAAILQHLVDNPHVVLSDIARDTGVPMPTLYYWINGRTLNLKTPAYWQAIQKWVEAHNG
jgi:predicted transcriptional regulator